MATDERIKQEVAAIVRTFYCELCDKQYANAKEIDVHLASVGTGSLTHCITRPPTAHC